YARSGDGIITAIMVMRVMIETQLPLSSLVSDVTTYPQVLKNVVVTDKDAVLADERVAAEVAAVEQELGDDGRVLLRKSGTEPVLRVMAEAGTTETCEAAVNRLIAVMEKIGCLIEVRK
ncbi:MAG: phosphoglucosamine mutase, partial [Oscillospiraceae bacterium]|nr:phosphoglucosamine mutase [Oscillospiraceae bacterium]